MDSPLYDERSLYDEPLTLDALPQDVLGSIFCRLEQVDLVRLEATCKTFRRYLTESLPDVYMHLLEQSFGVLVAGRPTAHTEAACRGLRTVYEELSGGGRSFPIRFRGVFTDGGMDGNLRNMEYFFDHLLMPCSDNHCCTDAGRNVHVVGLMCPEESPYDREAFLLKEKLVDWLRFAIRRFYPAAPNHTVPYFIDYPSNNADDWPLMELKQLFRAVYQNLIQGGPNGLVLFFDGEGNRRPGSNAELGAAWTTLQQQLQDQWFFRHHRSALWHPAGLLTTVLDKATLTSFTRMGLPAASAPSSVPCFHLASAAPRTLASAHGVAINREGKYSCPVKAGAVFFFQLPREALRLPAAEGPPAPMPPSVAQGPRPAAEATAAPSPLSHLATNQLEAARAAIEGLAGGPGCRALQDVEELHTVLQLAARGALPPIVQVVEGEAGVVVEFAPQSPAERAMDSASLDAMFKPGAAGSDRAAEQALGRVTRDVSPTVWFRFRSHAEHVAWRSMDHHARLSAKLSLLPELRRAAAPGIPTEQLYVLEPNGRDPHAMHGPPEDPPLDDDDLPPEEISALFGMEPAEQELLRRRCLKKRSLLGIKLRHPRGCNGLLVKLIAPENLMHEWDDEHQAPNIDITSVTVTGPKTELPHAVVILPK